MAAARRSANESRFGPGAFTGASAAFAGSFTTGFAAGPGLDGARAAGFAAARAFMAAFRAAIRSAASSRSASVIRPATKDRRMTVQSPSCELSGRRAVRYRPSRKTS